MDPLDLESEKLLRATDNPDISALASAYQKATPVYDRFHRIIHADDIRLNRWTGKSEDGKKYSTEDNEAFPFEGASDSENFLTDDTINELVALLVVGFWRSVVQRIHGVEAGDYEQAADFNRLLEWLMQTKLARELVREVELSAQYMLTYGYVIVKTIWDRRLGRRRQPINLEEISKLGLAAPPDSPLRQLLDHLLREDEASQKEAERILQENLDALVRQIFKDQFGEYEDELCENFKLSAATVRKIVRELRQDQESTIPLPYFKTNQPAITALKIGEDVFLPSFLSSIQEGLVFCREYLTESTLRSRAALEGWNQDWVEEAVKKKGKQSTWSNDLADARVTDDVWEFAWMDQETTGHDLIEVVTAYQWRLDQDDVAERYYTIFHADVSTTVEASGKNLFAKHGSVDYDHGQQPFVLGMREWRSRNFNSSRGVPLILRSRQRQLKTFYDGLIDLQSISVFPPLNLYDAGMGTKYIFGPAQQNPVVPGREPKLLDIPTKGSPIAFDLVQTLRSDTDNSFGLMSPQVTPTRAQIKQQMLLNTFLMMWTEVLQQAFALVEQYLPAKDFERITGSKAPMPRGEDIAHSRDFILQLDVRTLDMEHVMREFKAIGESVRPLDQEGVIDMAKLVRAMVRAINPALAREVVLDRESGSALVKRKVQNDLLLMMGGFEPEYGVDDDPTAAAKMQSLQEVLQTNPRIAQALGNPQAGQPPADPEFAQRFNKYVENIQFNMQQTENKTVGRRGV